MDLNRSGSETLVKSVRFDYEFSNMRILVLKGSNGAKFFGLFRKKGMKGFKKILNDSF